MKRIALTFLMIFAIALTACGASSSTSTPASTNTGNGLNTLSEVAVGMLKLDGTAQDVTADQARELLVLWQVYQDISQSNTAAQEEVSALADQIQETMTTDQMQAITAMNLTQQDVFAAMRSADVNSSSSVSTTTVYAPSGNSGMPAGGPQDGGGAPPDGGSMPADGSMPMDGGAASSGTDSGQGTGSAPSFAGSAGIPSTLIELVIQSLEAKAAS